MNTAAHIRRDHEELLGSLVDGKLPRNLSWSAVVDLIGQIGEVKPHGNDEFVFLVGSQREIFRRPKSHNLEVDEIARLRRFLRDAEAQTRSVDADLSGRAAVIIDHHAAHIYRSTGNSRLESRAAVTPYDPFGYQHHLIHRKEAHYKGERVPEEDSYYEEIARDLAHAASIVLIGHATGTSSAVVFLSDYLRAHHAETFQRVVAIEKVDLSAMTEPQIGQLASKHLIPRT